jgi:hypothetical protein
MADQKREKEKLPVTAELGGEGGSYGDATAQAETFRGLEGNERVDPKLTGVGDVSGDGVHSPGSEPDPAVKPPTER